MKKIVTRKRTQIHKELFLSLRKEGGILPKEVARHLGMSIGAYAHIEYSGRTTITNFCKAVQFIGICMVDVIRLLRLLPKDLSWDEAGNFIARCRMLGQDPDVILSEFIKIYGKED